MSNLSILPEEIRHEFEIKEDGRVVAKSWRALARLCGVSQSVFLENRESGLRHKLLVGESLPKSLEPLRGIDLSAVGEISETVMSCFIKYFAWESQNSREEAQKVDLAMTAIGLRAVLQKELGWKPDVPSPKSYLEALELLVENEKMKQKVAMGYPGLSNAYDACGRESLPVPELPAYFYLAEWLVWKRIYLNHKEAISFGNFTASTVERDTNATLKRVGRRIKYSQAHLPLLDESYKAWLENRARKEALKS